MLNGKFALALAAAMVLATLYGCSSNSGIKNDRDEAITERDDALDAQMMAEQQRDDALDAQMLAEEAQAVADTARMTAEEERDAANMARTTAMEAEAAAVAAKMTAETAQMAAETAEMMAVAAKMTAETAKMMAVAAQGMAEGERDAAQTVANDAVAAQTTAETERDAALDAQRTAETLQTTAETERDAALDAQRTAEAAQMVAEDALEAALITVSYTEADAKYRAANTLYNAALMAYGVDDADVADATKLVSKANAALTAANQAAARATNGNAVEQAQARAAVTVAGTAVTTARAELEQAMTTMAAMPYAGAIKDQDVTADMKGTATAILTQRRDVEVTVMRGNTEIAKDADARLFGNGWYVAEDVREETLSGETPSGETATVYTDIFNTMAKFDVVHTAAKDQIQSVDVTTGVLTLATGANQIMLFNRYAYASAFPTAEEGLVTFTYGGDDDDNTETVDRPAKFSGTYDGLGGKFACTGNNCTMTANSKEIESIMGDWTFIPDYLGDNGRLDTDQDDPEARDDTTVPNIPVPDDDYLRFGWWTTVETDDDGTVSKVSFRTFYGGEDEYDTSAIGGLEKSATYKGLAAGRYARKTFNANATLDSIEEGTFTATAELTARFGGDTVAISMQNQIEGEITGFMDERSNRLDGWNIVLTAIKDLNGLTGNVFMSDPMTGVTGGVAGSPVNKGSWAGQFFGPNDTAIEAEERYPGSVAGKFDAHSSHGHVGGAFGAEK